MGPACAVADVRDGGAVVWFGGQKPYPMRHALSDLLKIPAEKIRVVWMPGPGSYGMNDADDCAADAALIAQAMGRPVRLQYMRADGTAWDPKGPPIAFRMRAGLASDNSVFAWDYEARGFSGRVRNNGTDLAGDTLAGQLAGGFKAKNTDWPQFPAESYGFPNMRKVSHTIDWNRSMPTGPTHRAPARSRRDGDLLRVRVVRRRGRIGGEDGPGGVPPALHHRQARGRRREGRRGEVGMGGAGGTDGADPGRIVTGRGIAYAPRNRSIVAIVANVEVDTQTGRYRVTRLTCAHDCGLRDQPVEPARHHRGEPHPGDEPRTPRGGALRREARAVRGLDHLPRSST
jgi:CO/xanthine dehydrogenase Mo-binding subunit